MSKPTVVPGIYRHYKGGLFRVVQIAKDDVTEEAVVVYHSQPIGLERGVGQWWVQTVDRFLEEVEYRDKVTPRFKYVSQ